MQLRRNARLSDQDGVVHAGLGVVGLWIPNAAKGAVVDRFLGANSGRDELVKCFFFRCLLRGLAMDGWMG